MVPISSFMMRSIAAAGLVSVLIAAQLTIQTVGQDVKGFKSPGCTPCKPSQPITTINCNCRKLVSVKVPDAPGLPSCLTILQLLCTSPGSSKGTVGDYVAALTATTQCLARLTALNANSTDLSNMNGGGGGGGGGGGNSPVGGRLLQQLLGGLGQNLDNLLKGLLGSGAKPGGGLLGQILSGGNTG